MERGYNKCTFVGRLGRDPEIRYSQEGKPVAKLSLGVTDRKDNTEWIPVVAFDKMADIIGQYLGKGSRVLIEGRWRTRKWEDKHGATRYMTECVASEMLMLGGQPDQRHAQSAPQASDARPPQESPPASDAATPGMGDFDDDIPF